MPSISEVLKPLRTKIHDLVRYLKFGKYIELSTYSTLPPYLSKIGMEYTDYEVTIDSRAIPSFKELQYKFNRNYFIYLKIPTNFNIKKRKFI